MKRVILGMLAAGSLVAALGGCATVASTSGPNTSMVGDAWYVQDKSFMGFFTTESRVFYCPAANGGPATCTEAKYVEGQK
jgi:hypothetical protein